MNAFLYFFTNLALLNLLIFLLGLFVGWLIWGRLSRKTRDENLRNRSELETSLQNARSTITKLESAVSKERASLQKERANLKLTSEELEDAQGKIVSLETLSTQTVKHIEPQGCDCEQLKASLQRAESHNAKLIKELESCIAEENTLREEEANAFGLSSEELEALTNSQLELKEKAKVFYSAEITSGQIVDDQSYGLIYTEIPEEEDDLTKIKGVGETLKKKLNEYGVFKFRQIAVWTPQVCADFSNRLSFKGRVERDNWIEQSKAFYQEKYGKTIS